MKLVEITAPQPPRGTAEYLERNQVDFTMHDDGTIDINQDFTATSSMTLNFPKINRVFGDFEMNMSEGRVWDQVMPFYVDGNCKINVGEGKTIKSSQIPQSTHGSGELTLTGEGILVLDDETMYSYSKQLIDMTIGGGLEFLPREWNKTALSVVDTVEGIPPVMENLTLLRMTLPNPGELKDSTTELKALKQTILLCIAQKTLHCWDCSKSKLHKCL